MDDPSESLSGEGQTTLASGPREVELSRGPLVSGDLGWQIFQGLVMAVLVVAVMVTFVLWISPS